MADTTDEIDSKPFGFYTHVILKYNWYKYSWGYTFTYTNSPSWDNTAAGINTYSATCYCHKV